MLWGRSIQLVAAVVAAILTILGLLANQAVTGSYVGRAK